jgi:membrane protease YdiL (CAAX protease family)
LSDSTPENPATSNAPAPPNEPAPLNEPAPPNEPAPLEQNASLIAKEISLFYLGALVLILGWVFLASMVPLVSQNLYALVAAVFVGIPYWWLSRRGANFERFGLTWERAGRGVLWGLGFTLLTLGPFSLGYWWWQTEVQEQRYEFGVDNFFKWPVEYEGRPSSWGEEPGVFVWAEGLELHVGAKSHSEPIEVELAADKAFRPAVIGRAHLIGAKAPETSKNWTVRVPAGDVRSQVIISRGVNDDPPREIDLSVRAPGSGDPAAVYQGASKTRADGSLHIDRGLWWVVLWILTQLVFIALPEEFFYRGYLQTRIKDLLEARRKSRDPDLTADPDLAAPDLAAPDLAAPDLAAPGLTDPGAKSQKSAGRRILGISGQNALASLLFAAGHLLIPIGGVLLVSRISVFFPSLIFGWLRERTGTIAAPIVYHAGANLMVLFAAPHFF